MVFHPFDECLDRFGAETLDGCGVESAPLRFSVNFVWDGEEEDGQEAVVGFDALAG